MKVLLIGGPHDGKRINSIGLPPFITLLNQPPIPLSSLRKDTIMPEITQSRYRFESLYFKDKQRFPYYVFNDIEPETALQMLFDRYAGVYKSET